MKERYTFRKIKKEEVPKMFGFILQRMAWMDEKGLTQWNKANYHQKYPLPYYESECEKGRIFVLEDIASKEIVSGAVILESDTRWPDKKDALYLHNFVSKIGEKGTGAILLKYLEEYALQNGKKYFRLDSPITNPYLGPYYKKYGFYPVGVCQEGAYKGILREKKLNT